MKGKSLWKAAFPIIISLIFAIFTAPAFATVPQQAKGAHSSSGTGNTYGSFDDLSNQRLLPEGYTGYTSNWICILNLHSGAQRATTRSADKDGYFWY